MTQARLSLRKLDERLRLFGQHDANLAAIESAARVGVSVDGDDLVIAGEAGDVAVAETAVAALVENAIAGSQIDGVDVTAAFADAKAGVTGGLAPEGSQTLATARNGRPIRARTPGQRAFVAAVAHNVLTFAIGPAGTGKTFLAVVLALAALRAGAVQRIVLSRPAVEAGENLGFLPGDLQQKVDPYLRPLFDALGEMMEQQAIAKAVERGQIEIAPLAYMRGRTLSDSFVVLDEGQNTSREQMKMFLTRIGANSRMVVCGDVTQIDLPRPDSSGLIHASRIFTRVDGVAIAKLSEDDVIRHPMIRRIIGAYKRDDT